MVKETGCNTQIQHKNSQFLSYISYTNGTLLLHTCKVISGLGSQPTNAVN